MSFGRSGVMTASQIEGLAITGSDGRRLGRIHSLLLDPATGRVRFVVVGTGGLLGVGEKYRPVPWHRFGFSTAVDGYRADFSAELLDSAPAYDREQLASDAYDWEELVERHFARD